MVTGRLWMVLNRNLLDGLLTQPMWKIQETFGNRRDETVFDDACQHFSFCSTHKSLFSEGTEVKQSLSVLVSVKSGCTWWHWRQKEHNQCAEQKTESGVGGAMSGGVRDSVSAGGVADRDAREAEESDTSDGAEGWVTQTGVVAVNARQSGRLTLRSWSFCCR